MSAYVITQIGITLVVLLIGHLLIRALGPGLPKSTSLTESLWRAFWVYHPDIPRDLVRRNHLSYLAVVIVAYIVLNIYRAYFPPPV